MCVQKWHCWCRIPSYISVHYCIYSICWILLVRDQHLLKSSFFLFFLFSMSLKNCISKFSTMTHMCVIFLIIVSRHQIICESKNWLSQVILNKKVVRGLYNQNFPTPKFWKVIVCLLNEKYWYFCYFFIFSQLAKFFNKKYLRYSKTKLYGVGYKGLLCRTHF